MEDGEPGRIGFGRRPLERRVQLAGRLHHERHELGLLHVATHGQDALLGHLAGVDLVHDVSSSLEVALEIRDEPLPDGDRAFDLAPVARDLLDLFGRGDDQDPADPLQRHLQASKQADQPSPLDLRVVVVPVARRFVDRSRPEQPELVIESERLQAETRLAGERTDRHELVGCHWTHRLQPGPCPLGRVKTRF